jgi:uncharacterized protein with ATP-grasp and redox domains
MEQALRAGRAATNNEEQIKRLLDHIGGIIRDFPLSSTPPEMANIIYKEIKNITGVEDPYKNIKKENINEALSLYPELKKIVQKSDNKLLMAIRIAIAGNVIDLGMKKKFNIVEDLRQIIEQDFAIFDFSIFFEQLNKTKSILYLGDNAGESVFDKVLIEELNKPVTYVVRDKPIINDVTLQDAIDSGLDEVADIISSGCPAPATILSLCNKEFLSLFEKSELIISKGQGNYEGLSDNNKPLFFLLKAKCPVIATDLNVKENDIVLVAGNYFN